MTMRSMALSCTNAFTWAAKALTLAASSSSSRAIFLVARATWVSAWLSREATAMMASLPLISMPQIVMNGLLNKVEAEWRVSVMPVFFLMLIDLMCRPEHQYREHHHQADAYAHDVEVRRTRFKVRLDVMHRWKPF